MNKPITLQIDELQKGLTQEIEQSRLPAVIIRHVLTELLEQVKVIEKVQYEKDLKIWENSQPQENE